MWRWNTQVWLFLHLNCLQCLFCICTRRVLESLWSWSAPSSGFWPWALLVPWMQESRRMNVSVWCYCNGAADPQGSFISWKCLNPQPQSSHGGRFCHKVGREPFRNMFGLLPDVCFMFNCWSSPDRSCLVIVRGPVGPSQIMFCFNESCVIGVHIPAGSVCIITTCLRRSASQQGHNLWSQGLFFESGLSFFPSWSAPPSRWLSIWLLLQLDSNVDPLLKCQSR